MITEIARYISEAAFFGLYVFFSLTLLKPRFSRTVCVPVYTAVVLCSCAAAAILTLNGKGMAALTLLPLIAYLPFSICAFVLSEGGISEGLAAFSLAALASLAASRVRMVLVATTMFIPANISAVIEIALVLLLVVLGADVALRYIRGPFATCMRFAERRHLSLLLPTAAFFLMIFINFNSTDSDIAVLITVITALAFFIIASRLLISSAVIAEANAREKLLAESLEQQKKSFDSLLQSVDAGRFYRHDMRHHLNVLSGMARRNNSSEIVDYIEALNISPYSEKASAPELICKNPAINAMLSDYISRAEKLSCRIKTAVSVPEELPFELPDVCVIFANALENALLACEKCPENERYIDLFAEYSDDSKLKISVKNSCAEEVELDGEGLPVVKPRTDGHGLGLRSVKKTVEKYDGFIFCKFDGGEFHFCAEIFHTPNGGSKKDAAYGHGKKRSKAASAVLAFVICAFGIVNFSPDTAAALSDAFSVKLKTLSYGWGDNRFNVKYPEFSGEGSADSDAASTADIANTAARDFVAEAQAIFREYALQKYEGSVALDAGYRVYIDDRALLSARFFGTLNVGGSADFSRCVVIDKMAGKQLSLGDLFPENRDYISEISAEVLRQMEFRVEYQGANYFIPGGIWSDDECFKEISPEQDFFIDANGQLVIVFDEYTVAPGSEGAPEFIMPPELFAL